MSEPVFSQRVSCQGLTSNQLEQKLLRWVEELEVIRALMADEHFHEYFFMAPGAYTRIFSIADQLPNTTLGKSVGIEAGTLLGIKAQSPIFLPTGLRDVQGLSEYQIEYRLVNV